MEHQITRRTFNLLMAASAICGDSVATAALGTAAPPMEKRMPGDKLYART